MGSSPRMLCLPLCLSLIVSSGLISASEGAPNTKDLLHAECSVKWTLSEGCESAQQKIIDQMNAWDNEDCGTQPGDTQPNGQKCLYKHTGTNGLVTTGTHTTPIHRIVDDLSISETLSVFDFGTNYCNLFNLMEGSGLT